MLAGGEIFAEVTGLASGRTKPEGWMFYIALSSIILYIFLLLSAAISGIFLLKILLKKNRQIPL